MLLTILISLSLEIPIGYGQLSFNPVYFLKTQTQYGDYTYPILPSNVTVSGFPIPFNNDVSLYFSKTFTLKSSIFSFEFIPKDYNVKKSLTILNSGKGSGDFSYAGLFFKEGYRNFDFSFSGDFTSYPFYKTSAIGSEISYKNERGKTSVFFYRFKRDSLRYIKILLIRNKFDSGKKNVDFIYGESFENSIHYFTGIKGNFYLRGVVFDLLMERTSAKSYTWRLGLERSGFNLGVSSPFESGDVLPEIAIRKDFKNLFINLESRVIEPLMPDSNYFYYSLAGLGMSFFKKIRLYMGGGYLGEGGIFTGGYKFITGNLSLSQNVEGVRFDFAGKLFKPLEDINFNREFNSRVSIYYERKFGGDSRLGAGFFVDYFGDSRLHFSVFSDVILFNSVRLRVEEYNLNGEYYPFLYPGNNVRFYRISVVTHLWN